MQVLRIKKATLVEKLVAEVRCEITSGRLAVGQSLPTEAKMAAQFGVSRVPLREALDELRAEGFVDTMACKVRSCDTRRGPTWSMFSLTSSSWRLLTPGPRWTTVRGSAGH